MRLRWWHWPILLLVGLFAMALLAYAVGATLPTAHTATVTAHVDAAPDTVWRLITDVERFPDWRPDVEGVTRLEDRNGLPAWREALGTGTLTFETVDRAPPAKLMVRIADRDLPFGGTWTYELEPDAGGTRLAITEDGRVDNPLFRFLSRYVFGHESTIRAYLDAVRAELGSASQSSEETP